MPSSIRRRVFLLIFLLGVLWPVPGAAQSGVAHIAITHLAARAKTVGQVQVVARLSVLDEQGRPVTGLIANDFTISENNQAIDRAALTVTPATDPLAVTLLLDTSGNMAQPGPNGVRAIDSAKDAVIAFVEKLGQDDRLAVYEFDRQPEIRQDFTFDHNLAIDQGLVPLDARPETSACFYDALQATLESLIATPDEPHIVVALTGNPLPGPECGPTTVDDLLDTVTPAGNPIPVYTVAFGPDADEADLLRLGRRSGGYTWSAPDAATLPDVLAELSTQLSRQYQLSYNTQAAPGLARLSIIENSAQQAAHRQVVIPSALEPTATPPPQYTIGLSVEQQTSEMLAVQVMVPPEISLTRSELYLNDDLLQTRTEAPFDMFEIEVGALGSGQHLIRVEAVDTNQVTATAEVELTLTLPPTATPAPTPTSLPPEPEAAEPGAVEQISTFFAVPALAVLLVGGGILLLLIFLAVMVWFLFFRSKGEASGAAGAAAGAPPPPPSAPPPAKPSPPTGPATLLDVETPSPGPSTGPATLLDMEAPPTEMPAAASSVPAPAPAQQAKLVVIAHQQLTPQPEYDLPPSATIHIGRNTAGQAINQIPVQEKEVSRSHARITYQNGQYWLEDLNSTTGTSVDGARLPAGQPKVLQNGTEITVGLRVTFRFEMSAPAASAGDETLLDLDADGIRAKYGGEDPRRTLYD